MGDQPERAAEGLARNGLYKIAVESGPKGVGDVFNLKLIGHQHDVRLWKLAVKITAYVVILVVRVPVHHDQIRWICAVDRPGKRFALRHGQLDRKSGEMGKSVSVRVV